jgi:uncharacterized membrane protein
MALLITRIINIGLQTVVVSVTFGAWLQLSPALLSFNGPTYAEVQQTVLHGLKRFMPFVLLLALVSTILDGVLIEHEGAVPFDLTLAAAVFFLAFLYITIRYEFPINQEVEHWTPANPPPDWEAKRRQWEKWQTVRAWLSVAVLASLIGASLGSGGC